MSGSASLESLSVFLPVLLVMVVIGVPMAVRLLKSMRRAEGTITSSEARQVADDTVVSAFIPVIDYTYRFNGIDYTGSTSNSPYRDQYARGLDPWNTPMTYEKALAVVAQFPPGSRCTVYPDLADHSRSILPMRSASSRKLALILSAAIGFAALLIALLFILESSKGMKGK